MAWSLKLRGVGRTRHPGFEGRLDARLELRSGALARGLDARATAVRDGFALRGDAPVHQGRIGSAPIDSYVMQFLGGGSQRPRVTPPAWRASDGGADAVGGTVASHDARSPYSDILTTALRSDFSGYAGGRRQESACAAAANRLMAPLLGTDGRLDAIPKEALTAPALAWVTELGVTNIILGNFGHYLGNLLGPMFGAHGEFLETHMIPHAAPSDYEHLWPLFGTFVRTDEFWRSELTSNARRYGEVLDIFVDRKEEFAQALTTLYVPYGIHRELVALLERGEEWGPVLAHAFGKVP